MISEHSSGRPHWQRSSPPWHAHQVCHCSFVSPEFEVHLAFWKTQLLGSGLEAVFDGPLRSQEGYDVGLEWFVTVVCYVADAALQLGQQSGML